MSFASRFFGLATAKVQLFNKSARAFPIFFENHCNSGVRVFYKLVSMEGRVSILLECIRTSLIVSFCFSFSHVARYVPS